MPFDGVGRGLPSQGRPPGADEWSDFLSLCFLAAATAVMGLSGAVALERGHISIIMPRDLLTI